MPVPPVRAALPRSPASRWLWRCSLRLSESGFCSGLSRSNISAGVKPCPLCLEQRIAYYVAIPLAAMILLGVSVGAKHKVLVLALFAIAAAMLWNAGLGVYHSGIEWQWWPGPQDCSGTGGSLTGGSLLEQMQTTRVVRCDEAAWRFLGLSLAGYNVLISLALAAIALCAGAVSL